MPHTASTRKRLRQSERLRTYNRAVRTFVRSMIKKARAADAAAADETTKDAYAALDRSVKRNVVPRRRADRLKSRLARRANKIRSS